LPEKRRGVPVKIWLPNEDYAILKKLSEREGYETVSDFIASIISSYVKGSVSVGGPDEKRLYDNIAKKLERVVVDLLNPYTGKLDDIYRRLAVIQEILESRQAEADTLRDRETRQQRQAVSRGRTVQQRRGTTAMDRLKEEGVVFQEDLSWLRAPDRFFQKLEREGAIVIDLDGERVAVDPAFWREFTRILPDILVRDPDEASSLVEASLGRKHSGRLFLKLVKAGYVYYDEDAGVWTLSSALPA